MSQPADALPGAGKSASGRPPRGTMLGWRGVFFTGLGLWIATIVVTAVTQNINNLPTVVLLGSFLVPATAVVWYVDHYQSPELTSALVVRAFIIGGVLGTLAASVLESWLLRPGWAIYFGVGLIEEGVKLLALVWVARTMTRRTIRDGIVLGASVGFGFAALESSGYALGALIVVQNGQPVGFSLSDLVITEILRGVLAPIGHGLWTGILGGVLFAATPQGGFHPTRALIGTYLLISALHGLFDSSGGIAAAIAPSSDVESLAISLAVLIVISVAAFVMLIRLWRSETDPRVGARLAPPETAPPEVA